MASQDKGRPLPKFGDWDVNNPASADGFTVIFSKARNDKNAAGNGAAPSAEPRKNDNKKQHNQNDYQDPSKQWKWFCCF